MYFSVITHQDGLLRQAAHELAHADGAGRQTSPYGEHQWLWRFFPDADGQARDFIFRRHEVDGTPRFYVVSQRPPVAFSPAWQVRTQPYAPELHVGQRLRFELRANPVVSKKDASGKSRRHDVVMQAKRRLMTERGVAAWKDWKPEEGKPQTYELVKDECVQWLTARAAAAGFEIVSAEVDAYQQNRTGKREIQFSSVDFSGELIVSDVERFQRVLLHGLGHAKAFGCALLLVRRAES